MRITAAQAYARSLYTTTHLPKEQMKILHSELCEIVAKKLEGNGNEKKVNIITLPSFTNEQLVKYWKQIAKSTKGSDIRVKLVKCNMEDANGNTVKHMLKVSKTHQFSPNWFAVANVAIVVPVVVGIIYLLAIK